MDRPISDITERQLLEAVCRGDDRLPELANKLVEAVDGKDVVLIVSLLALVAGSALSSHTEWHRGPRRDLRLVAKAA